MRHFIVMFVLDLVLVFQSNGQDKNAEGDPDLLISSVEYSAEFPGGVDSLKSFVYRNLKRTPTDPKGQVFVQFWVNTDGTTSDYKVVRSLEDDCDKRAIEVLQGMPKWKPAMQRGKQIRIRFVIPIQFE